MLIKINIRIKVKVGILCATAKLLGLLSLEIRPQIIVKRRLKYFSIYVKKFCISGSKTIEHKCSNEMLKRNFMNFQTLETPEFTTGCTKIPSYRLLTCSFMKLKENKFFKFHLHFFSEFKLNI